MTPSENVNFSLRLPSDREEILKNLLTPRENESEIQLLVPRIALQVTANLILDHKENQLLLITCLSVLSRLKHILETSNDKKSQFCVTLIIQTLLKNNERDESANKNLSIFVPVLADRYHPNMEDETERCLEHFLSTDKFLKHLTSEQRMSLVDIIPFPPHDEVLRLLIFDFNYITDVHLLTTG